MGVLSCRCAAGWRIDPGSRLLRQIAKELIVVTVPLCDTDVRAREAGIQLPAPTHAFTDLLKRRRSIRKLRDGPLPPGAISRIATAASLVPSAFNAPPWHVAIIHGRRDAFWGGVEAAFREQLSGERLDRYLTRLDGFRSGAGAVLVFEDRAAVESLKVSYQLPAETAESYGQQAIGMVQLALWLAIVEEGLATSLQHWESLIEDAVARFLDLPVGQFRLTATMPFGYPDEQPRELERIDPGSVISLDGFAQGGRPLDIW
jgi:predicted oxidoreductase (fatty acid repression mutant protein)